MSGLTGAPSLPAELPTKYVTQQYTMVRLRPQNCLFLTGLACFPAPTGAHRNIPPFKVRLILGCDYASHTTPVEPPEHRRRFFILLRVAAARPVRCRKGNGDDRRYGVQASTDDAQARARTTGPKLSRVDARAAPLGAHLPARRMDDAQRFPVQSLCRTGRVHGYRHCAACRVACTRARVRRGTELK